jgi:hypothetical protein
MITTATIAGSSPILLGYHHHSGVWDEWDKVGHFDFEIENASCQKNVKIPTTGTGSSFPMLVPSWFMHVEYTHNNGSAVVATTAMQRIAALHL